MWRLPPPKNGSSARMSSCLLMVSDDDVTGPVGRGGDCRDLWQGWEGRERAFRPPPPARLMARSPSRSWRTPGQPIAFRSRAAAADCGVVAPVLRHDET